jgi:hypothetical protein
MRRGRNFGAVANAVQKQATASGLGAPSSRGGPQWAAEPSFFGRRRSNLDLEAKRDRLPSPPLQTPPMQPITRLDTPSPPVRTLARRSALPLSNTPEGGRVVLRQTRRWRREAVGAPVGGGIARQRPMASTDVNHCRGVAGGIRSYPSVAGRFRFRVQVSTLGHRDQDPTPGSTWCGSCEGLFAPASATSPRSADLGLCLLPRGSDVRDAVNLGSFFEEQEPVSTGGQASRHSQAGRQ